LTSTVFSIVKTNYFETKLSKHLEMRIRRAAWVLFFSGRVLSFPKATDSTTMTICGVN
jgi:hypothetical protein